MAYLSSKRTIKCGLIKSGGAQSSIDGWLLCDGQAVSRTLYIRLFEQIGTSYGVGDGSSTFNIPDLRGEFVRGHDTVNNYDFNRSARTVQGSSYGEHAHPVGTLSASASPGQTHTHDIAANSAANSSPHQHQWDPTATSAYVTIASPLTVISNSGAGPILTAPGGTTTQTTSPAPATPHTHPSPVTAGNAPHSHSTPEISGTSAAAGGISDPLGNWPGSETGSSETRPRNVAVNYFIKY